MLKRIISLLMVVLMTFGVVSVSVGCGINQPGDNNGGSAAKGDFSYETYDDDTYDDYSYNKNLYYLNELNFEIADPTVIYVEEGEGKGYFYAYGTSDLIQCHGFQCWRSKDMTNWEYVGVAFEPDYSEAWAYNNYWAPEVLYDDGVYYLFYNAQNIHAGQRHCISVAVSQTPYGPFESIDGAKNLDGKDLSKGEPVYDFSKILPGREGIENDVIDAHAFIDPVTGDKYLYFSAWQRWHTRGYQEIFGVKMKDWFTPDYSTLTQITSIFNTTVGDFSEEMSGGQIQFGNIDEGQNEQATVNEGPFVYYHDGTYYMTYSVYPYTSPNYQVRQALATSPLGDYTKVAPEDGGTIIYTESDWENLQSAGHHCFIRCGEQLIIAYHTFLDRSTIQNGRALAVDEIKFVKNDKGQTLMHTNGPTYSYQPLPSAVSGYKNLAPQATITASHTASDSDVKLLTDGLYKSHKSDLVDEYKTQIVSESTKTTINFKFDDWVNVRSLLLYNSLDYYLSVPVINSVKLKYKTADGFAWAEAKNVKFNYAWNSDSNSTMYAGGSIILEFDEMPVMEIELTINLYTDMPQVAIGEIMIMGREVKNPAPVTEFKAYDFENPDPVEYIKYAEGKEVGTVGDFNTTWGYGDLSTDDGTEDAYIENTAPGDQFAYFKGAEGYNFYFEAELTITEDEPYRMWHGGLEQYPKFGLVLKSKSGSTFFYIDSAYNGGFNNKAVGYTQRKQDNSDYDWAATEKVKNVDISYTNGNYTKLAIARVGDTYYFFVNDQLFETATNLRGLTGENVVGGCLVFNMGIRVKNYNVISGESEVVTKLQSLGIN
ncbi:MAG: family 43 glycosylhydrolase [Clostridia bacterium]|nr:family 43 glycosylhydrolase [Clostridia bacterium]